jgi:hypothetical protein
MSRHVFASYARADEAYVEELSRHLSAQGVEVWTDAAIYFGDRWPEVIEEKIDSCAAFVVVMSPAARKSSWVGREVLHALEQGKRVFPLLLSGRKLFVVGNLQYEDVRHGGMPSQRWVDDLRASTAAAAPACSGVQHAGRAGRPVREPKRATLAGHTSAVFSVAFAPNGRTLATGSLDKTVRLWESATGRHTVTLTGHTEAVTSVAFSPDGDLLAAGGTDGTVRLWEAATGRHTATLTGHTYDVESVAFSPEGCTLATGSFDKTVRLWEVATCRCTATLTGERGTVHSVVFSPDGCTLATGGFDGRVRLWEVATGRCTATLDRHPVWVRSVVFSPDGCTLATGGFDGRVRLWEVATGRRTAALIGHTGEVFSVAFSPGGGVLATGGSDRTVRLWWRGGGGTWGRAGELDAGA